jgi:TonB family protein
MHAMSRRLVTLGLTQADPPEAIPDGDGGPISAPLSAPGPGRRGPLGGMAFSAVVHALIVAVAVQATAIVRAPAPVTTAIPDRPRADRVFLPAPDELRQMLGVQPEPRPPRPRPKDRISIGPPAAMRTPEPLLLHRDDDLTATARGTSAVRQNEPEAEVSPPSPAIRTRGASSAEAGPILASLRRLESGPGGAEAFGLPSGTGGQMGPLFFDPQGADFTLWIQRFKNEVYRNWIAPPSAALGWKGQVSFEFVVDRTGTILEIRLLEPSGTGAYDRAARNALVASRLLPLPADFAPATVTMGVGFLYNLREGRRSGG